jgi:hypothetical protein
MAESTLVEDLHMRRTDFVAGEFQGEMKSIDRRLEAVLCCVVSCSYD